MVTKTDKLRRSWSKTLITTYTYKRFTKSSCQGTFNQNFLVTKSQFQSNICMKKIQFVKCSCFDLNVCKYRFHVKQWMEELGDGITLSIRWLVPWFNEGGWSRYLLAYEGGTKKIRRGFLTLCMQLPKAKLFPRFIVV